MRRRGRTLWEQGREPARGVVALSTALVLSAAALEVWLTDEIGWLVDLTFVAVCTAAALLVRPADFFTVGVMPPLLLIGTIVLLAAGSPETVAEREDALIQAVVSGLSHNSLTLVLGYALCLGCLAIRRRVDVQGRPLVTPRNAPGRPRHGG